MSPAPVAPHPGPRRRAQAGPARWSRPVEPAGPGRPGGSGAVPGAGRALGPGRLLLLLLLGLQACGLAPQPPQAPPTGPAAPVISVNSLGMRFVRLPAGGFLMGSEASPDALARLDPGLEPARLHALADEAPVHAVRFSRAFWMGQHEVTVGQFRRFLQASGHVPESVADGTGGYGFRAGFRPADSPRGDAFAGREPRYSWADPGFPQGEDHPVVNVSWHDAVALADWLSRQEGRRYRLPTEAEWEYACRAGSRGFYPGTDEALDLPAQANLFDLDAAPHWPQWRERALPRHDGFAFTAPVGSLAPNAFGLHDMVGNVWEWVADWHADDAYAHAPAVDPTGPATGTVRVRRGGSWHTWPLYARCSYRNWNTPSTRYTLVGIRLLREAAPDER